MKTHDKILLAGELLLDSAKTYRSAKSDVEFAKCILLAGAVIGIIGPWLTENGTDSTRIQSSKLKAKVVARIQNIDFESLDEKIQKEKVGRYVKFHHLVYNSLKHSGNRNSELKASDDLVFQADLKEEAYCIIGDAILDYNRLPLSQERVNTGLSGDLLTLLQSPW